MCRLPSAVKRSGEHETKAVRSDQCTLAARDLSKLAARRTWLEEEVVGEMEHGVARRAVGVSVGCECRQSTRLVGAIP